ncbi:MAG TPA: hypothetical protein VMA73_33215 [Streptosporangiaceae bacterium]|nr:hypothetical protein [Streptosporangiaceae bacterium]
MREQSGDGVLRESIGRALHEMADKEQPQSRVSIQQGLRDGRARLRRRRLMRAAGVPVLAAAAVSAIAVGSISLPLGSHAHGPNTGTGRHFSALAPYATFGWLPANEPAAPSQQTDLAQTNTWGTIDANTENLNDGPWNLTAYAIGACHRAGNQIDCPNDQRLPGQPNVPVHPCGSNDAEVQAPKVNGRQAFWEHNPDQVTTVNNGQGQSSVSHMRCLTWEYAPGGWASLSNFSEINPGKQLVVRIASKIRFGGQQPSLRFAAQFRNLPGKWRVVPPVSFYMFRRVGHKLRYTGVKHGALLAEDFTITDGATTIGVDVNVFPSKRSQCVDGQPGCRVINGYHVSVRKVAGMQMISAPDADNLWVSLTGSQQSLGLLYRVFAHMTMLGTNPAAWTTQPIATPSTSGSPVPAPSTSKPLAAPSTSSPVPAPSTSEPLSTSSPSTSPLPTPSTSTTPPASPTSSAPA